LGVSKFVQVGETVPDIVLPGLDGNPVELSSFRGKKLLVFMWASW
jgi:peroxiredoxin